MVESAHMGVIIGERGLVHLVCLGRDALVTIPRHAHEACQTAHTTRCIVGMLLRECGGILHGQSNFQLDSDKMA